jgi:hypothetical protein
MKGDRSRDTVSRYNENEDEEDEDEDEEEQCGAFGWFVDWRDYLGGRGI